MDKHLNLAIVGCGMVAGFHLQAIHALSDLHLAGVFDPHDDLARKVAHDHKTIAYATFDSLLADPAIDAVSICTPSGLHAGQAIQAIQAGKHVLIEKPMALNLADCDQIIRLAKQTGVLVSVVSQLRFSPGIRQVRQMIGKGLLGKIVSADLYMKYCRPQQYYDQNPWRGTVQMDGGGALMNQGIHGVDLLRYIMGPLKSITAQAKTLVRQIETEDTLSAIVEYGNGALGVIQAMTSVYPGFPRRIEINGEQGSIILEEDMIVKLAIAGETPQIMEQTANRCQAWQDPSGIGVAGHLAQYRNFAAAIRGREPLVVDVQDGRRTLEIIIKAYESARIKQTVFFDPTESIN